MCSQVSGKRRSERRFLINNRRREMLNRAKGMLSSAASLVSTVTDGEEDSLDNMPENLQYGELYEKKEAVIDILNEASECIDTAIDKIAEAAR